MATDRIILHTSIASTFLNALKSALSPSDQPDQQPSLPTLVSIASKQRLQNIVNEAIIQGASPLTGPPLEVPGAGFVPVILGDVPKDSTFWKEENFGPAVGYLVVDSEEEAVQKANETEYGLSASVFTTDLRKGLAIAKKIKSGWVFLSISSTWGAEVWMIKGGRKFCLTLPFPNFRGNLKWLLSREVGTTGKMEQKSDWKLRWTWADLIQSCSH